MRAILCCPGPSLATYKWIRYATDDMFVVAVNRAIEVVDADWWVIPDTEGVDSIKPLHYHDRLQILTKYEGRPKLRGSVPWSYLKDGYPWLCYDRSALAALILCIQLGALDIYAFGMDWIGEQDWDGRWQDSRNPERWVQERIITHEVLGMHPEVNLWRPTARTA